MECYRHATSSFREDRIHAGEQQRRVINANIIQFHDSYVIVHSIPSLLHTIHHSTYNTSLHVLLLLLLILVVLARIPRRATAYHSALLPGLPGLLAALLEGPRRRLAAHGGNIPLVSVSIVMIGKYYALTIPGLIKRTYLLVGVHAGEAAGVAVLAAFSPDVANLTPGAIVMLKKLLIVFN